MGEAAEAEPGGVKAEEAAAAGKEPVPTDEDPVKKEPVQPPALTTETTQTAATPTTNPTPTPAGNPNPETTVPADIKKEPAPKEPALKEPVQKEPVQNDDAVPFLDGAAAGEGMDTTSAPTGTKAAVEGNAEDNKTWNKLSQEAMSESTNMDRRREVFESILDRFPLSSQHWIGYAAAEQKEGAEDKVEAILKRSLLTCASVALWEFYIKYVDEKTKAKGQGEQRVEILKKAFEFALHHVGFAMTAHSLWRRYLEVLKAQKAESQYEKSQRMTTLRRVYQRAVVVPMHQVDTLWREYERFENDLGKNTAQKLLNEYTAAHSKALAIYRERKTLWAGLISTTFPERSRGKKKEEDLMSRWMKLIKYEESNPEKVDAVRLRVRVRHAYIHALSCLQFYPDMWFAFAASEKLMNDVSSSMAILDRALYLLPESLLLHFTRADLLESLGRTKEAKERYEALLVDEKNASSLTYIQFMKFLRRTEGEKAARTLFLRARKSAKVTSAVYIASAWMEFKVNRNARVAQRVFEMGMSRYAKDPTFAQEYLRFISMTNQPNDATDLFERLLKALDPKDALPVWKMYRQFCADVLGDGGDIQALEAVEKRIAEAYPSEPSVHGLLGVMHRYSCFSTFYDNAPKDDQAFYTRNKVVLEGQPVGEGALLSAPSSDEMPEFLQPLVALLPKKIRGTPPDADAVLNRLRNFRMPARPAATTMPAANGRKRGIGAVAGEDVQDLYALRQKLS